MDTQSGYGLASEIAFVGGSPSLENERRAMADVVLGATPNSVKLLIAGGVAGGLSKTAVAPLERIKILYQVCVGLSLWIESVPLVSSCYWAFDLIIHMLESFLVHFSYDEYCKWIQVQWEDDESLMNIIWVWSW